MTSYMMASQGVFSRLSGIAYAARKVSVLRCTGQLPKFSCWQQNHKSAVTSTALQRLYCSSATEGQTIPGGKVSLVIFDKDGTLISFDSIWTPYIYRLADSMEEAARADLRDQLFKVMGFCPKTQKWSYGGLNGTQSQVLQLMAQILEDVGVEPERSNKMAFDCFESSSDLSTVRAFDDPRSLFRVLKQYGVKIAICTTDDRLGVEDLMDRFDLHPYVDLAICGDDPHGLPKPHAHNVHWLCRQLGVPESETLMVGDTRNDILMGSAAGVKANVAVLTGVSEKHELSEADIIVPSVGHVLPLVVPVSDIYRSLLQTSSNSDKQTSAARSQIHTTDMLKEATVGQSRRAFSTFTTRKSWHLSRQQHRCGIFYNRVSPFSTSTMVQGSSVDSEHDYVIVGAGSAGCVLANRISAEQKNDVLLLEAGPVDHSWTWQIHMPAALMYALHDKKYNWCYWTTPQKNQNGRRMYWPRGRMLGGSSSHNGMVFIRGHAFDFDRWEEEGASGWSYADCLPYFIKSQTHESGANKYRGGDGPQYTGCSKSTNELMGVYMEACEQANIPFTDDFNGFQQEGYGLYDISVKGGRRANTSGGYLHPVKHRKNLRVETKALTTRVVFEGNKAVGVEYKHKGNIKIARARQEVILSGGAINSPQLLMLSGIGHGDHLKEHGIDTLAHVPGVGQNLQDHLEWYVQHECKKPITMYRYQWKFPHNMIKAGLQWFLFTSGDAATTHMEGGAFLRNKPEEKHPNVQFHFTPCVVNNHGLSLGYCHAYQIHTGALRPTSRGSVTLQSPNPEEYPLMDANYMDTEHDWIEARAAVRLARVVARQKAFEPYRGPEIQPGSQATSDSDLDAFIRAKGETAYHASCTCKMGQQSDPMAVVDSDCHVFGVENLRVVDASVMPSIVSGNLNATTIMIAEKAADKIIGKAPLAKAEVPVYATPDHLPYETQ